MFDYRDSFACRWCGISKRNHLNRPQRPVLRSWIRSDGMAATTPAIASNALDQAGALR